MAFFASTGRAIAIVAVSVFAAIVYKGYQKRKWYRQIQASYGGPALPGHSWLFGDIITLGKIMAKHPSNIHLQNTFHLVVQEYPEILDAGAFYLDIWPISYTTLVVFDPDICAQFTTAEARPKHDIMRFEFEEFSGCKDLVCSNGAYWKKWRSVYNPGFSSQNVMTLVPEFIEEAAIWKDTLLKVADTGEEIQLEQSTMRATCDMIGRSILGVSLGIQTTNSKVFHSLKELIKLLYADWSPETWPVSMDPLRRPKFWYFNRMFRNEIRPIIESQLDKPEVHGAAKTINSLAVRAYRKEVGQTTSKTIDPEFLDVTVEQMKIFLLAGHDTTSSTLCFAYYYLYHDKAALQKVRDEHDLVFGINVAAATKQIAENPHLLNKLPFTMAVIKEVLRLQPPICSVRSGSPTFFLNHPTSGRQFTTDGLMLCISTPTLHRHPKYFSDRDEFIPERWLDNRDEKATGGVFRPFEQGPRNCIGQEVALAELKLLLVSTARDLDIVPMYNESDPVVMGAQAYQILAKGELTAHPSRGMPVTVKRREHATVLSL